VGFTLITHITLTNFGTPGLNVLSYVVGITDIDPFLLNLFQGKLDVSAHVLVAATLQAIISNNILKMIYGIALSGRMIRRPLWIGFLLITVANVVLLILI
jgi:uncharacterized membrane protein (DUF4010 family)